MDNQSRRKEMFIQLNNRLINLAQVSNVRLIKKHNKLFFNLGYSIETDSKMFSDYVDISGSEEEFNMVLGTLTLNPYIQENFIEYYGGYINKNHISSIKSEESKLKICINLSNQVSFRNNESTLKTTSEYIYINSETIETFNKEFNRIKSQIL